MEFCSEVLILRITIHSNISYKTATNSSGFFVQKNYLYTSKKIKLCIQQFITFTLIGHI